MAACIVGWGIINFFKLKLNYKSGFGKGLERAKNEFTWKRVNEKLPALLIK